MDIDIKAVKEKLLTKKQMLADIVATLKREDHLDETSVDKLIRDYVLLKYDLFGMPAETTNLRELGELSVAKALNVGRERLNSLDSPTGCDKITSVTKKKVLLLMAIQSDLGIQFDPRRTGQIETTMDISALVLDLMNQEPREDG